NCPTDHDEIMRSRIDWQDRAEAAEAEVSRLKPYEDELRKIAADVGESDDPFAAWESIEAINAEVARLKEELAEAHRVIEPFAEVAEWDIGESETNEDIFRPMDGRYAVVKRITVGDLRRARSFRDGQKTREKG